MRAAIDPPAATLRWLQGHARSVFVCSNEERARLAPVDPNVHVIPMFVEPRSLNHTRDEARAALGLTGKRVVTLLGFVHGRKGHRLLIEALTYLPRDFMVVFAGGAVKPDSTVISDLLTLAEARDVGQRLRVTGYLSEDRLNQYLAATDLAVCPFKDVSASASLSTWLSAGRRILASDLPLISEYNAMEPGAIRTFSQHTPEALASGILAAFETEGEADSQAIGRLRDRLLLPSMLNRFVDAYAEALDGKSR
jgi:glycosyltransferase involved in cell wall biosynthesis